MCVCAHACACAFNTSHPGRFPCLVSTFSFVVSPDNFNMRIVSLVAITSTRAKRP